MIKNLFKACKSAAKCNISAKNSFFFFGEGVLPLDTFGVSMFLPETNPALSTILDPPLHSLWTLTAGHFSPRTFPTANLPPRKKSSDLVHRLPVRYERSEIHRPRPLPTFQWQRLFPCKFTLYFCSVLTAFDTCPTLSFCIYMYAYTSKFILATSAITALSYFRWPYTPFPISLYPYTQFPLLSYRYSLVSQFMVLTTCFIIMCSASAKTCTPYI